MNIIKNHFKVSKPVNSYAEIRKEAQALKDFVDCGSLSGLYNKAYAIAHAQVSETPYAFFVVSNEMIRDKQFPARVIINPEILSSPTFLDVQGVQILNSTEADEPCLSFPFRKPKRITRYNSIKVRYRIPAMFGFYLKTIEQDLTGVVSGIFQHEYDHTQGKNIFFNNEPTVKWWELAGKPVGVEKVEEVVNT
jgi:peptide deformylase